MPPIWQSARESGFIALRIHNFGILHSLKVKLVKVSLFSLQKWLKTALDEFYASQFRTGARVALQIKRLSANAAAAVASLLGFWPHGPIAYVAAPRNTFEFSLKLGIQRTPRMAAAASKAGKAKSTLIPLGDRVVVEREQSEQTTSGGILLPDSAKDKPARGVVVSVGEGKLDDKGNRHPLQVKPGDRVVFTSYAGEAFQVSEQELLLMREDDILAVLG